MGGARDGRGQGWEPAAAATSRGRPAGARIGLRQERRREIELQPLPALELAGKLGAELGELHQLGLTAAFSITPAPMDLQQAYQQAEANLEQSAEQLARLLHGLSGRR